MKFTPILFAATLGVEDILPANAIVNGHPDGNNHPNVGGLVNDVVYSDGTWIYCSGTLIAPKVFLTAAHCVDDVIDATVTFSSEYKDGDKTYTGEVHLHPEYLPFSESRGNNVNDVAVVVFSKRVGGVQPASLPAANSLSDLPNSQEFTSVGYGMYQVANPGQQYLYNDVRMEAVGTLNAVTQSYLHISSNPAGPHDNGGTCYGDSGGPNFLGTSDTIAAITYSGDTNCRATNDAERADRPKTLEFLKEWVDLEDV